MHRPKIHEPGRTGVAEQSQRNSDQFGVAEESEHAIVSDTERKTEAKEIVNDSDLVTAYAIHPDLPDLHLQRGILAKISGVVFSYAGDVGMHTVNQRKQLEKKAIQRMGFVFVSYKANFWYWEIMEMMRK
jgi:hypothetical protein